MVMISSTISRCDKNPSASLTTGSSALTFSTTCSVNRSTVRSRSLKHDAANLRSAIASTCAWVAPTEIAIGTCCTHSYSPPSILTASRIAFAQLRIQLLPPQNCGAQPREWNETGLGVSHHLQSIQLHWRLGERVAHLFGQLSDVRVWNQAHSSPVALKSSAEPVCRRKLRDCKTAAVPAGPRPTSSLSGTSLKGYRV